MHKVKEDAIFNCPVCTRDTWPNELEHKNLAYLISNSISFNTFTEVICSVFESFFFLSEK